MKNLLKILIFIFIVLLPISARTQQSTPNWPLGYIPTPAQWSLVFAGKLDYNVNGLAVNLGGTGCNAASGTCLDNISGFNFTGIMKRTGAGTYAAAVSGTDYAPATSGGSILYGNGSGGFSAVTIGANLSFSGGTLNATGGGGGGSPGGSPGQIQYNNSGAFGGFTLAGDCTISIPNITCLYLNGQSPGTSFGVNTGTTGGTIPLNNGGFTQSGAVNFTSTFSIGGNQMTFPGSAATLLATNGNGSSLGGLTWSQIGSTPTTYAGYGITSGALPNGTTATTQSPGDNSTKVATTAYVNAITPGLTSKIITFTRANNAGNGNISYTGVGFTPTSIKFIVPWVSGANPGTGFTDSSKNGYFGVMIDGGLSGNYAVMLNDAGGSDLGTIASYDSDGFTITWATNNSPGGETFTVYALCEK